MSNVVRKYISTSTSTRMSPPPPRVSLRRSCQACIRSKRKCDQQVPRCTRCQSRGLQCGYINAPLPVSTAVRKRPQWTAPKRPPAPSIHTPLPLEIAKEYDQGVIHFLVDGLREFPLTFATSNKTLFVHPELHGTGTSSLHDAQILCQLHAQAQKGTSPGDFSQFWQKSAEFYRRFARASSFEELLCSAQAVILIQCILALGDNQRKYTEAITTMLDTIATRLWQQAPIQLPSTLSPRRAWVLAESVRRTIIVSLMLRSAYSLKTRNYSTRNPFVDALPFDVRTDLWDRNSDTSLPDDESGSPSTMISLHEYSDALESGRVHDVDPFGALILAACKGKQASAISFPPAGFYIEGGPR